VLLTGLRPFAAIGAGLLVLWNLLLLGTYRHWIVGPHGGTPEEMLHFVSRFCVLRPLEAAGMLILAAGFTAVLVSAIRKTPVTAEMPLPERRAA
jgi:hypothetical protein